MLKSIIILFISFMLALSAQAEIKTSIPDFSKIKLTSLSPVDVDLAFRELVPSKSKFVEEHIKQIQSQGSVAMVLPAVGTFEKKFFLKQNQSYRAYYPRTFHLLI